MQIQVKGENKRLVVLDTTANVSFLLQYKPFSVGVELKAKIPVLTGPDGTAVSISCCYEES